MIVSGEVFHLGRLSRLIPELKERVDGSCSTPFERLELPGDEGLV